LGGPAPAFRRNGFAGGKIVGRRSPGLAPFSGPPHTPRPRQQGGFPKRAGFCRNTRRALLGWCFAPTGGDGKTSLCGYSLLQGSPNGDIAFLFGGGATGAGPRGPGFSTRGPKASLPEKTGRRGLSIMDGGKRRKKVPNPTQSEGPMTPEGHWVLYSPPGLSGTKTPRTGR